jgi:hypothetical protein
MVAVLVAALGACNTSHSSGCGAPVQEKLDSRSALHLFPGAPEPVYQSDPPTSGPHRLGPRPTGIVDTPIDRPVQVAMLEAGDVLIQYKNATDKSALAPLAAPQVTVAPNPTMSQPVVATAWTWKLSCRAPNTKALRSFVAKHLGVNKPAHTP